MGMWAGFAPGGAAGETDPVRQAIGTAVEAREELAIALDGTSSQRTRRPTIENEMLLAAPSDQQRRVTHHYLHPWVW